VIKASDEHEKFVLLTGVSQFSGLSIFSGLNNLNNITMNAKYGAICGYTQEELEVNFKEYIEKTAEEMELSKEKLLTEIKKWYNGYSWDGKTFVYNPFSTLLFFSKSKYTNYWFKTGTPTIGLLFQTGYLTIKKEDIDNGRPQYTMDFPNMEVREAFIGNLLEVYANKEPSEVESINKKIAKGLKGKESENLARSLSELFANIPYDLTTEKESYYLHYFC
jgi:hypothetical protein